MEADYFCRDCGGAVERDALRCRHCGHGFDGPDAFRPGRPRATLADRPFDPGDPEDVGGLAIRIGLHEDDPG